MIGFQGTLAPRLARSKLLQDSPLKNNFFLKGGAFLLSLPFADAVKPSRLKEIGFQPGFQCQEEIVWQNALRLAGRKRNVQVLRKARKLFLGFRVIGFQGALVPRFAYSLLTQDSQLENSTFLKRGFFFFLFLVAMPGLCRTATLLRCAIFSRLLAEFRLVPQTRRFGSPEPVDLGAPNPSIREPPILLTWRATTKLPLGCCNLARSVVWLAWALSWEACSVACRVATLPGLLADLVVVVVVVCLCSAERNYFLLIVVVCVALGICSVGTLAKKNCSFAALLSGVASLVGCWNSAAGCKISQSVETWQLADCSLFAALLGA